MSGEPQLEDEATLITGATAGIGEATAHAFAERGANVALAARRGDELESIADDLESAYGVDALAVPTDVTEEAQVESLVDESVEAFGGLDVAVSNAGVGREETATAELPTENYRQMMDVNVDGTFFVTRAALPHLADSGGTVVFIGSFAGQYPRPGAPVYAATKWWVRGFARSLEGAVGDDGVGVSGINPTEVRTQFGSEDGDSMSEAFDPGEVTEPEEVAEAVAFAATREAPNTASEIDLYRRDKLSHF